MRAIISVVGKDRPGILAFVAQECANHEANIVEVSQTVLKEMFTMIMVCEVKNEGFSSFIDYMESKGKEQGLIIHVMHEDIFNAMHKI
ncbi:MAG: ACT domain-containing protein [Erysipelotrichaceae bacterium]|nr:ACT domain-containing protein [Erysipelotrichaceae bacterium]MDY5251466.1 ACT domain-containing protein [Erysipelotrichaceae bacterium]